MSLRKMTGLNPQDCSRLCALSKNVWRAAELAERPIPKAAFELFCLKTGQDFSQWSEGKKSHLPSNELISKVQIKIAADGLFKDADSAFVRLRYSTGLSVADLAKFAAVSKDHWMAMEQGQKLSASSIELVARKLHLDATAWALKDVYIYDAKNSEIHRVT